MKAKPDRDLCSTTSRLLLSTFIACSKDMLNLATQARVEQEYHRSLHTGLKATPPQRYLRDPVARAPAFDNCACKWERAQELADKLSPDLLHKIVDHYAEQCCPILSVFGQRYHWSLMQIDGHLVKGCNFFDKTEHALSCALQAPRSNIAAMRRADVKPRLSQRSVASISRYLKRLRLLGVINRH